MQVVVSLSHSNTSCSLASLYILAMQCSAQALDAAVMTLLSFLAIDAFNTPMVPPQNEAKKAQRNKLQGAKQVFSAL
jgi:hypothetical protein